MIHMALVSIDTALIGALMRKRLNREVPPSRMECAQ